MGKRRICRHFNWREDNNGNWGWMLKGTPDFDAAVEAIVVYHDAFEHLEGNADFVDELQSFGAMLFIRHNGGFEYGRQNYRYTLEEDIASDLGSFLRGQLYAVGSLDAIAPLRTKHTKRQLEEDENERFIAEAARLGMLSLREEWDEPSRPLGHEEMERLRLRVMHWMRVGYARTERRWGSSGVAAASAYTACMRIEQQTKYVLDAFGSKASGVHMVVSYTPGEQTADVRLYWGKQRIDDNCF